MNRQSFTEFEAFTESVRDADLRMRMSALEVSRWTLNHLHLGSIHIQVGLEGSGNIAEGSIRPDGWAFYNQTSGIWGLANGEQMQANATVVVSPGSEFCFACPDGQHNWYSVFVPTSLLLEVRGEEEEIPSVDGSRSSIRIHQSRCMQDLVERLLAALVVEPTVLTTQASVTAFQEEIRSAAIRLLRLSPVRNQAPKVSRQELVKSAVKLIEGDRECSLTIAKIAELSEIPERTLRSAFNDWFGVSPRQYLSLRRLHDARKMLCSSCPDQVTVAQVAVAHGFWDLGRFAGRYRKLFGELPSETRRKKSRR